MKRTTTNTRWGKSRLHTSVQANLGSRWGRNLDSPFGFRPVTNYPLVETFACLPSDFDEDGAPIPWIRIITAHQHSEEYCYDRVQYIYDCNVRPCLDGRVEPILRIWHAAVVFWRQTQVARILLIAESEQLDWLRGSYPLWKIARDAEHAAWTQSPVQQEDYLGERAEMFRDLPYLDYQIQVLPTWSSARDRQSVIDLIAQHNEYLAGRNMERVVQNFCYELNCYGDSIRLHFCSFTVNSEQKIVTLVQRDY